MIRNWESSGFDFRLRVETLSFGVWGCGAEAWDSRISMTSTAPAQR